MNFLLLPDFLAMSLLVFVLLMVGGGRRSSNDSIRLWTAGLLLILLECAARIVYGMHTSLFVHRAVHIIALSSYAIAGALFVRSACTPLRRMPRSNAFLFANLLPHLVLMTVYGLDSRHTWLYRSIVLTGMAVGFASSAIMRCNWRFYVAFAYIWTPMLIATTVSQFRTTIYISLFVLYMMAALGFLQSLPRGSRGKIAVVAGFTLWALCFLTHPWIANSHPEWANFASELWNMQKFIITVGLLLVLLEEQIKGNEWLALHDALTNLPNRRLFDDRLQHEIARADRDRQRVALFNLDLDGFKQINDTLGHDAGDVLLRQIAANLNRAVRRTDTLARLGGDEFSLIAIDIGGTSGNPRKERQSGSSSIIPLRIQELLLNAVEQPVQLHVNGERTTVQVSASIGVAIYPEDGTDVAELLKLADRRMYEQKAQRSESRRGASRTMMAVQTV